MRTLRQLTQQTNKLVILVILVILVGCAGSQQDKAAKAMLITQTAIVDVATTADQLCSQGILTQSQCDKIGQAYQQAKIHYNLAESALEMAIKADTEDAWTNYQIMHENFQRVYGDLLAIAFQYGITPQGEVIK